MIDILDIRSIAEHAGQYISKAYPHDGLQHNDQIEDSRLKACTLANNHVLHKLNALTPQIPVLSAASTQTDSELHYRWARYWLVDLLEDTKGSDWKNNEFTINIALIEDGEAVMGVVHAPVLSITYWGTPSLGAFKASANGRVEAIHVPTSRHRFIDSNSYASDFMVFKAGTRQAEFRKLTNSLRLCVVAEGDQDLYPRVGPTSEWDTAAAHAVITAAGGQVVAWPTLEPLHFTKRTDTHLNPYFIISARLNPSTLLGSAPSDDGIVYEHREHHSKADVVWHRTQVNQVMRAASLVQRPRCIWLTGLSGSGKSTIANSLELSLHHAGRHTFLLDGDNVRQGLNKDLGMSAADRAENIRRVGEVAKLMVEAGMIVVTAFISPFRADRDEVRALFSEGDFIEVFVDTPLEECERRDVKGLYAKARRGELKDFTGIDSSYEEPVAPDVHLLAGENSVQVCVDTLLRALDDSPKL